MRLWGPWARNRLWRLGDDEVGQVGDAPKPPGGPTPAGEPEPRLEGGAGRHGAEEERPAAPEGLVVGRRSGVGATLPEEFVEFKVGARPCVAARTGPENCYTKLYGHATPRHVHKDLCNNTVIPVFDPI